MFEFFIIIVKGINLENKNLSVKKSNYLNQASYKLSVVEQKVIALLAAQIKETDTDFQPYCLNIKKFQSLAGNKSMNYTYIEDISKSLQDKEVNVTYTNDSGDKVHLKTRWLASSKYVEGSGVVELRFDPNLKPFLLMLKNRFTMYKLENIIKLTSQFSIRIYELLKQYENTGTRIIAVDELRDLIGIDRNKYKLYADFKKRIIAISQKELKEKSDISFEFDEIKEGHSVKKLLFHIKKKQNKSSSKSKSKEIEDPTLTEMLLLLPEEYRKLVSIRKNLIKYLETEGRDYVIRNIIYTNDYSNRSNYRSYLSKALKNDYGLGYQEDKEVKKAIVDKQRAKEKQEAKEKADEKKRVDKERDMHKKAREMLKTLPESELKSLEKEVSQKLINKNILPTSATWPFAFRLNLESLFIERHPEEFK